MKKRRFVLLLSVVAWVAGCATVQPARSASSLVSEARARGVALVDPLRFSPEDVKRVREAVGTGGSARDQLERILRYLVDSQGGLDFQYAPFISLDAHQAYARRAGNCITYATLFLAMARAVGLAQAHYVRVTDMPVYYAREGTFFASSHMAVGYGWGSGQIVVDFSAERTGWELGRYRDIDDRTGAALFNLNLAVDDMEAGREARAEARLRFLREADPELPDVAADLVALLIRTRRFGEAVEVSRRTTQRFPGYHPLFVNAALAAREAGRPKLAKAYESRARALAGRDPALCFSRGLALYQQAAYGEAAHQFRRALAQEPDAPTILAWATRAQLSAGRVDEGKETYRHMLKVVGDGFGAKLIRDLRRQFPQLAEVRTDPRGKRLESSHPVAMRQAPEPRLLADRDRFVGLQAGASHRALAR